MERRAATESISRNMRAAIGSSPLTVARVSQATAVAASKIDGSSSDELSLDEVVAVGGLLRVPASSFLREVA